MKKIPAMLSGIAICAAAYALPSAAQAAPVHKPLFTFKTNQHAVYEPGSLKIAVTSGTGCVTYLRVEASDVNGDSIVFSPADRTRGTVFTEHIPFRDEPAGTWHIAAVNAIRCGTNRPVSWTSGSPGFPHIRFGVYAPFPYPVWGPPPVR